MKTLLTILLLFILSETDGISIQQYPTYLDDIEIVSENIDQTILTTLRQHGISEEFSLIILAQARHETGNFTSDVFWENNNAFGMKQPKKRQTTCIGTNRGHGVYEDLRSNVTDYVLWMQMVGLPCHEENLLSYVITLKKKRYFEDNLYKYYRGVKHFRDV